MYRNLVKVMGLSFVLVSGAASAGQVIVGGQSCVPMKPNAGYKYSYSIGSIRSEDTVNNFDVVCPIPNLLAQGAPSVAITATVTVASATPSALGCTLWKQSSIATPTVYLAAGATSVFLQGITMSEANNISVVCTLPKKLSTSAVLSSVTSIRLNW